MPPATLSHPQTSHTKPPTFPGHSLLGVLPEFRRDALGFFTRAARTYGDVVRMRFGPQTSYLVSHPDDVRHILQGNHRNYRRESTGNNLLKLISGHNLFTSDGEYWLRQRRLMQPVFHRQRIARFGHLITEAAGRMLESWKVASRSGEPVDVREAMMRLTLEVVGQALFSIDLSAETSMLGRSFRISTEYFNYRLVHPISPPLFIPTRRNREFIEARQNVRELLQGLIELRRQAGSHPDDLMSMLLEVQDPDTGRGMTDEQIRSELGVMIGAGHETTANALTWTLYLLSEHPEVEARLLAELDTQLGGRTPTVNDLPRLAYTRMVLDESLRLYPPAWSLASRQAIEEDVLGGYRIPSRTGILILPYVLHRDPRFWEAPETFDPGRHTPERSKDRHKFAYLPFGGGPRKCIGDTFAITEALLVLATLLQNVRLRLVPGHTVEPEPIFALRVRGSLPMRVLSR